MRVPEPKMLWEVRDAGAVLAERFGHADAASAVAWLRTVLDDGWGLDVVACDRLVMSDGNALAWVATPSGRHVAKWSVAPDRFARLAALAALTDRLGTRGLPVSAPVPTRAGDRQLEVDGVSLGLQREVDGDLLDTGDAGLVREAGAVLARLHGALADEVDALPGDDGPTPLAARVTAWLDAAPPVVPEAARTALRAAVAVVPDGTPAPQLVHGDYRAANLLCRDGAVVAVLDLEEARTDHRVVELARAAVLLGTRFHDWAPVPGAVHAGLRAGYESVSPLTAAEAAWWDVLVPWTSFTLAARDDTAGWAASALAHLRASGAPV